MPKMKTVSGAAKRFKKTGSGRFKSKQSHLRLLTEGSKRKRHLRGKKLVHDSDTKLVSAFATYKT